MATSVIVTEKPYTSNQHDTHRHWVTVREGVLGDEQHIGLFHLTEGFRYNNGGIKECGAVLAISWIIGDHFYSSRLLKTQDGRTVFLRDATPKVLGGAPKSLFEYLDAPPYSGCDPILDAPSLAFGFAKNCGERLGESIKEVQPLVEAFLARYYDADVLNTSIGRPVTAREYSFLQASTARRQAVEAMPWLLVDITLNFEAYGVSRIIGAIDRGEELIPLLCEQFGVKPNVVRSMSVFPAWSPSAFRLGEIEEVDAATIALTLSQIAPEHRPDRRRVKTFMAVLHWVETIVCEVGGQACRSLVAKATAETWKRLHRRPQLLPAYHSVYWLSDFATVAQNVPDLAFNFADGVVCGERVSCAPQVWAVAECLCRFHPTELVAMGRKWNRRELGFVLDSVRKSLPPGFPMLSSYPDRFVAKGGWTVRRIATVDELVDEAVASSHCLAAYLPALIRQQVAIFCLVTPDGNTEGHFSLEPIYKGQTVISQIKRYRNLKATPRMKAVAQEFLAEMKTQMGNDFPAPLVGDTGMQERLNNAIQAVDAGKIMAHAEAVKAIFEQAAKRLSIQTVQKFSL